jgi:predicted phage terminase large subunit-like protein
MNVYILDAKKEEWKPPELIEEIFRSVLRWQPRLVAIEEVLFSGLFQHWLQREMSVRGISFKLLPVKTGGKKKEARVLGLSNYFSAGQIYFNNSQKDLIEEFYEFGATDDYHMLDALAYGPALWRIASNRHKGNSLREAEDRLLEHRDKETGYGSY